MCVNFLQPLYGIVNGNISSLLDNVIALDDKIWFPFNNIVREQKNDFRSHFYSEPSLQRQQLFPNIFADKINLLL